MVRGKGLYKGILEKTLRNMKPEVVAVRLIDPNVEHHAFQNGLRGFADVQFTDHVGDSILVRDIKIFQRGESVYFQSPNTTFKKDGKLVFNNIITISKELRDRLASIVISAYFIEKEKAANGKTGPQVYQRE